MTTTTSKGDAKGKANAKAKASNDQKALTLAQKKACNTLKGHWEARSTSLTAVRQVIRTKVKDAINFFNAKEEDRKKARKTFSKKVEAIFSFMALPEFAADMKALVKDAVKSIEKASHEELLIIFDMLKDKEQKAKVLDNLPDDSPARKAGSRIEYKVIRIVCPKVRISDASEAELKDFAKYVSQAALDESRQGEVIAEMQAIAQAIITAAKPGCDVHGGISSQEYARVAAGLMETRGQAEARLSALGDITL